MVPPSQLMRPVTFAALSLMISTSELVQLAASSGSLSTHAPPRWLSIQNFNLPCVPVWSCLQVVPLVVELSQRVSDHMGEQPEGLVDVSDGARRITSDIMGQMLLGEDLGGTRYE